MGTAAQVRRTVKKNSQPRNIESVVEKELQEIEKKWETLRKVVQPLPDGKFKIFVSDTYSLTVSRKDVPLSLVVINNEDCKYENEAAVYLGHWVDPAYPNNKPQHWLLCEGEEFPYYFGSDDDSFEDFSEKFGITPVVSAAPAALIHDSLLDLILRKK
jgi:hypothetical protein